jgi:hypothetical protein
MRVSEWLRWMAGVGRKQTDDADIHQCPGDAVRCKAVRSGARLIWDKNRHQPTRGEHDSRALVYGRQSALPWQSWRFSGSPATSPAKRRCAIAPALQATPSPLASIDSQIVRRQWVSPATVAWNFLAPGFAAVDIGEVDDRRTISTDRAPATKINRVNSISYKSRLATAEFAGESAAPSVDHTEGLFGS